MSEQNLVETTVNVGESRLTLAGFGVPVIIGAHTEFSDLYRRYSGRDALTEIGVEFGTDHPVYKAAAPAYRQTSKPTSIVIARQEVDTVLVSVNTFADTGDVLTATLSAVTSGNVYKMYLHDGTNPYSVSATAVDASTPATIAAALVAAINGTAILVTAAASGTTGLTLTADTPNTAFKCLFVRYAADGTTLDEGDELRITGGYFIRVSGQVAATTSTSAGTVDIVATALAATVELAQLDANATAATDTVTLVSHVATTKYAVKTDARCSKDKPFTLSRGSLATETPTGTLTTLLTDLADEGIDYYGAITLSANDAQVLEVAAIVEASTLIYGISSRQATIYDSTNSADIASLLAALGYNQTFGDWEASNDTFPEAAVFGENLPSAPGSRTWKNNALTGVTVTALKESQQNVVLDKGFNLYTSGFGSPFWTEGLMVSGRPIDVTRDIHYMKQAVDASVVSGLLAADKVPMSQPGLDLIGNWLRGVAQSFYRMGITAPLLDSTTNELYRVTVPDIADISTNDRNLRHAPGFIIELQLAGAVHKVFITVNANI